jgi:hypothetical protein
MRTVRPHLDIIAAVVAAAALAGVLAGCDHGAETTEPTVFIALDRDFAGFRDWPHVTVGVDSDLEGHPETDRVAYVNALPDDGVTVWPVGTVIVKSGLVADDSSGDVVVREELHAMVKRGGDFNASGALGWEWMELVELRGTPTIAWRGSHPPDGDNEAYGCRPGLPCEGFGDCNACHAAASPFDFVMSEPLRLPDLDTSLFAL